MTITPDPKSIVLQERRRASRHFRVVLVQPEKEGNIGSIARAMRNFSLTDLYLVLPQTAIGDEAYRYATRGREILEKACVVKSLSEALKGIDLVVGTTAIVSRSPSNLLRIALNPEQVSRRLVESTGSVALLFGRESSGLNNSELQRCDVVVNIPASEDYNVLNVAMAASIVFYELFKLRPRVPSELEPSRESVEMLARIFAELTDTADLPSHRKRLAERAFRNVLAKSGISRREVSLIMGVLRRIRDQSKRKWKPA